MKKRKIRRAILHPDGSITYREESWEEVEKRIEKILKKDKMLLEILEKL